MDNSKWWQEPETKLDKPVNNLDLANEQLNFGQITKIKGIIKTFQESVARVALSAYDIHNPNRAEAERNLELLETLSIRMHKHLIAVNGDPSKLKEVLERMVAEL